MNSRTIGRLVAAAAVAASIVVSDPGGAGDVAAPIAVADSAVGAGSHAIIIGDPGGDGPGSKVVTPGDPGARPEWLITHPLAVHLKAVAAPSEQVESEPAIEPDTRWAV